MNAEGRIYPTKKDKILFCVRLHREAFYSLDDAAKATGETKSTIARRALARELARVRKEAQG
jgi:predicted transcriptional regulator